MQTPSELTRVATTFGRRATYTRIPREATQAVRIAATVGLVRTLTHLAGLGLPGEIWDRAVLLAETVSIAASVE